MKAKKLVSHNIRKLRESYEMNQSQFAEFLGYPLNTYKDWEYGKTLPKADALEVISQKCNVEISKIFEDDSKKELSAEELLRRSLEITPLLAKIKDWDSFLQGVKFHIEDQDKDVDDLLSDSLDGEEEFYQGEKKSQSR